MFVYLQLRVALILTSFRKKIFIAFLFQDKAGYNVDFGDSDNEAEPDAYLARVKAEGQERSSDDDDDGSNSDESTDDDFNPDAEKVEEVADEFDSNVESTDSEDDSDDSATREKKKKKKENRREKSSSSSVSTKLLDNQFRRISNISLIFVSQSKPKSKKKKDDDGKPKRAATAFMLWLNDTREQIKKDNPSISVTEIAKKGGEMWRELKDKTIWEEKAAKDKERYANEMKNYKPSGGSGGGDDSSGKKRKKESSSPKKSSATTMAGSGFKSKEYISDDDSSSGSEKDKKTKKSKVSDRHNKSKFESI